MRVGAHERTRAHLRRKDVRCTFVGMKALLIVLLGTTALLHAGCDTRTSFEREVDERMKELENGTYTPTAAPVRAVEYAPAHCANWVDVASAAEHYVKLHLSAPATAEFPIAEEDWKVTASGRDVTCSSYVDSQNGFGALLRTHFVMELNCTDDGFKMKDVKFY